MKLYMFVFQGGGEFNATCQRRPCFCFSALSLFMLFVYCMCSVPLYGVIRMNFDLSVGKCLGYSLVSSLHSQLFFSCCKESGREPGQIRHVVSYLGYWWRDQMATRAVEENVKKARRSFFRYGGIGVFQGDLSPLSFRSVVEVCVMPILMYGCENWIVSEELLRRLESFREEMGKGFWGCHGVHPTQQ